MKVTIYMTEIAAKYKNKKVEHMIGEKLLEIALKEEYGRSLRFEPRAKGEHGKPFFTLQPSIHYNISHSGDYVVCAIASQPVGIDIQQYREASYEKILKRMVAENHIRDVMEAEDIQKAFFDKWAALESYIKWTGEGLSRDLKAINMEEGWHQSLPFKEGYSACIWMAEPHDIIWKNVEVERIE